MPFQLGKIHTLKKYVWARNILVFMYNLCNNITCVFKSTGDGDLHVELEISEISKDLLDQNSNLNFPLVYINVGVREMDLKYESIELEILLKVHSSSRILVK